MKPKTTKRIKSKKKQKNEKNLVNQCSECCCWFSCYNYNIHLTQCQILQDSLAMDIHQESYNPLNEMTKTALEQCSTTNIDFGCFTKRIDLKHNRRMERKTFDTQSVHQPEVETIHTKHNEINGDLYQIYEKAWTLFKTEAATAYRTNAFLQIQYIPFPPNTLDNDGLCVLFGLTPETPPNLKRDRIRRLFLRW